MLYRHWYNKEGEFTTSQFITAVLINLLLLLFCFFAYQAAYRIEQNSHRPLLSQTLK